MILLLRCVLILVFLMGGTFISWEVFEKPVAALVGGLIGLALAIVGILIENRVKKSPPKSIIGGVLGLIVGLVIANLFSFALLFYFPERSLTSFTVFVLINCLLGFLGLGIGASKAEEIIPGKLGAARGAASGDNYKILDTSAIIDGRIAEIFETGFVEGTLIIPQFVLQELVYIADSSDSLRRNRTKA